MSGNHTECMLRQTPAFAPGIEGKVQSKFIGLICVIGWKEFDQAD